MGGAPAAEQVSAEGSEKRLEAAFPKRQRLRPNAYRNQALFQKKTRHLIGRVGRTRAVDNRSKSGRGSEMKVARFIRGSQVLKFHPEGATCRNERKTLSLFR